MKPFALSALASAAAFAASAGTLEPMPPAPVVSETACALDTRIGGLSFAAEAVPLDTLLEGWDWSPWPGIFLNTKPCRGFVFSIR